jgi:hypothetical protein
MLRKEGVILTGTGIRCKGLGTPAPRKLFSSHFLLPYQIQLKFHQEYKERCPSPKPSCRVNPLGARGSLGPQNYTFRACSCFPAPSQMRRPWLIEGRWQIRGHTARTLIGKIRMEEGKSSSEL